MAINKAKTGIVFLVFTACWFALGTASAQKTGTSVRFKKITITKEFVSEGIASADVNNDGKLDIMAGSFWYAAPDWKQHLISSPKIYFPDTTYSNSFLDFPLDVNQDGWVDLIRVSLPGNEVVWYENPVAGKELWKEHLISAHIGNESPAFTDVDGDGRVDIICNDPIAKKVIWIKSPAIKGDSLWKTFTVSNVPDIGTDRYTHGLGFGDINRDGRKDIIITKGWWEQPGKVTDSNWIFHSVDLGPDCAQIYTWDVDGDGDADLISSSAHNYGIWWREQMRDSTGNIEFIQHGIYKSFSQTHGLVMADINGDGNPDLITGKRYFAHNGKDPGAFEPAVLYWFEYKPSENPKWIPHLIDENSGVGLLPVVIDLNGDGLPDIMESNKKGVYIFEQIK